MSEVVRAEMAGPGDDAGEHVRALPDATAAVAKGYPGLRVEEAGDASIAGVAGGVRSRRQRVTIRGGIPG
ncbi:hypothetical protein [Streptomyces sp. NPDC001508]|uniref:hypothetical protein n=1 Tax=Streptomyces sp. NPDC001508 TaxID=3154656 RepID=UPI00331EB0F0